MVKVARDLRVDFLKLANSYYIPNIILGRQAGPIMILLRFYFSSPENTQSGHHLAIILAGAIGGAILLVIVVIVVYKLNINAENVIQICCCFLSICD